MTQGGIVSISSLTATDPMAVRRIDMKFNPGHLADVAEDLVGVFGNTVAKNPLETINPSG